MIKVDMIATALVNAPKGVTERVVQLAKEPSAMNWNFLCGYLRGAGEFGGINPNMESYFNVLINQMLVQEEIRGRIIDLNEEYGWA